MTYAIIGDLHSAYEDTTAVLQQIQAHNLSDSIIGLGDLYECVIGKKKLQTLSTLLPLEDAAIMNKNFIDLLTFPSVIGNQEERIALVTGEKSFLQFPEEIHLPHALVKHGHQFDYTDSFELIPPTFNTPVLFFGHSHHAAIYRNGIREQIEYDVAYPINLDEQIIVNVGSVIQNREWCIYDEHALTVTFKKSRK